MTRRWYQDLDRGPAVPGATAISRGPEHRMAALALAMMLVGTGLLGTVNLFVGGMLHGGLVPWIYGGTMALVITAALPLAIRRSAGRWHTFGLVLLGDLVYVVVVFSMEDPVRYTTPLMLMFPAFVAAWFLGPWELGSHMVLTSLACLVALQHSYDNGAVLAVQVGISAGMLNAGALGIFVLRRRVQRLLVATETLTRLDPLTGLFNRRVLVEEAPRLWRQARRDGVRVAALVLDLDHFKRLNDAHGHAAGDAVLREVACALSAAVRPSDVLARTGGEELVVLGLVGDPDEATHLAERLRSAVAAGRTADGHAVTASIGVALTRPADGEDPTDALWRLVDRADAAMYEAKQQGRDRVAALRVPDARSSLAGDAAVPAATSAGRSVSSTGGPAPRRPSRAS
jgi:diguanylate cyclase (GGDEF)-like protein